MKSISFVTFIFSFFLIVTGVFAARAAVNKTETTSNDSFCNPITSDNHDICCGVAAGGANATACQLYQMGISSTPAPTTTTSTQTTTDTTSGGTSPNQCSGDIYSFNYSFCCVTFYSFNKTKCDMYNVTHGAPGTVSTQPVGGATTADPGTIAATPQASSVDLATCSAIKFLSLLDILIWIKCIIITAIIPLLFAAALLFFLWGVTKYTMSTDSKKREESKKFIMAGLIGLFVMTSVWGIIKIASTTLGLDSSAVPMLQTTYLKTTP